MNNDLIVYIYNITLDKKTIDLSTTLLVLHLLRCSHYTEMKKLHSCRKEGRKEGRKELVYLTSITIIQNIHR